MDENGPNHQPRTDVPHSKVDVLVLHSLHVESNRRNSRDNLAQLQLVQNGGLTSSIETNHQNSHLLLANKALEQLSKNRTHVACVVLELLFAHFLLHTTHTTPFMS